MIENKLINKLIIGDDRLLFRDAVEPKILQLTPANINTASAHAGIDDNGVRDVWYHPVLFWALIEREGYQSFVGMITDQNGIIRPAIDAPTFLTYVSLPIEQAYLNTLRKRANTFFDTIESKG